MTHEALHNAIRSAFSIAVGNVAPIQWDNGPVLSDEARLNRTWIRFTILTGESGQVTCGGNMTRRHRTVGVAMAQIFSPVGGGDKAALAVADRIKQRFLVATVSGVRFRTASIKNIGRDGDEWQYNVEIPFWSDDVR